MPSLVAASRSSSASVMPGRSLRHCGSARWAACPAPGVSEAPPEGGGGAEVRLEVVVTAGGVADEVAFVAAVVVVAPVEDEVALVGAVR